MSNTYLFGWSDPKVGIYNSTKLMAYAAIRMKGLKVWRWEVVQWSNIVINPKYQVVADNLTKEQAEGMVKLLESIQDEQ